MLLKHKDDILLLRKNGLSYKQIRDKLKCSLSTISHHCRKLVDNDRYASLKPSADEIVEFQRIYDEVQNIQHVVRTTGWTKGTIRKYIQTIPKPRKITSSVAVVKWRKRTKEKLVEYKGGKCEKCGYKKCINALQFHHTDPSEKDFTIGGKSWSFERLKEEVDKCILVCANCHIEIHSDLRNEDLQANAN